MARKIVHQLIDDLDQEVLSEEGDETVTFRIDGAGYEIDLSLKHAAVLREALVPFVHAGRKARAVSSSAMQPKRDLGAIRTWAWQGGHEVSDRGRIAATVVAAYDATQH